MLDGKDERQFWLTSRHSNCFSSHISERKTNSTINNQWKLCLAYYCSRKVCSIRVCAVYSTVHILDRAHKHFLRTEFQVTVNIAFRGYEGVWNCYHGWHLACPRWAIQSPVNCQGVITSYHQGDCLFHLKVGICENKTKHHSYIDFT